MDGLKKRWHYYLAALLFILGLFFYARGHAYENPHAIRHLKLATIWATKLFCLIGP